MNRIKDKIKEVKRYVDELEDIIPDKFQEYSSDKTIKAACERYFEKIVEGITDIAFMIISQKKFRIPEDDIDSFRILTENKLIKETLYKKLKEAKGMRNFIAHQYSKINDKLVFEAITGQLENDINEFINAVDKFSK